MAGVDLLSIFLENQDIFTDEDIAKNLLGFQFAATETIDYGTQTILTLLTQSKHSIRKVREEFEELIYKPLIEEDPSLASLPISELLDNHVTFEMTQDLQYVGMVIQEALRCQPPATYTTFY